MRILVCAPFPPNVYRGNSVAATRLTAGFESRGHTTQLLTPPANEDAAAVRGAVASFRPDAFLVLHAWRCATAFQAIRDCSSAPVVVSLRGTDVNEMLGDPDCGPTLLSVLETSAAITVFHESMRAQLARQSADLSAKTHIVPNGLVLPCSDVDYRSRLGVPTEAFVFVTVSGLRTVKRPLALVGWLSDLRAQYPKVHLVHAGPPLDLELAERYHQLTRHTPWLHHEDAVPHEEMDSFLRVGDVYASASRSEGMPHAVREAMAVGLPALLSDIPGHRAMADEGAEALFFQDTDDFARQAARLIEDQPLRTALGHAARKRVTRELRDHDEIGAYLALLEGLVYHGERDLTGPAEP